MTLLKRREAKPDTPAQRERKAELVDGIRARQRVDLDALTLDEATELRDLHRRALDATDEGFVRPGLEALSDRERKRFLELLDQCLPEADRERQRFVREERERRALQSLANELANEGVPPATRLGLRSGEVVLPPGVVELDALRVSDMGVLVVLLHGWSAGTVPLRGGRWSDEGTALVLPKRLQLVSEEANRTYDPGTGMSMSLMDIGRTLDHLARNGFLEVEREPGGSTVVRLGPRLREHAAG